MPLSPQQQYSEYGLLIPRATIKLKDLSGMPGVRVEPPSSPVKPVVITTGDEFDLEGLASGRRSGLLSIDGVVYKFKGCAVEEALNSDRLYTRVRKLRHSVDTLGGQLLSDAQNEIEWTLVYNGILAGEGFPHAHDPAGIIHYGKKASIDTSSELTAILRAFAVLRYFSLFGKSGKELQDASKEDPYRALYEWALEKEDLAASVMKVKGDTRLLNFATREVHNLETAALAIYAFGLMAGSQKKFTEDEFLWGAEALHIGNYLIFVENGRVFLNMTDFEDARKTEFFSNNLPRIMPREIMKGKFRSFKTLEQDGILYHLGARKDIPDYFKQAFTRGFNDGYKNPDRREEITIDMLVEAFDLSAIGLN